MKWKIGGITLLGIAALCQLPDAPGQGKTAPGWLKNFDQAKAQARQTGKPIFLVFR